MPWDATEKPAISTVSVATYPAAAPCPYCMVKELDVFWKDEEADGLYMAKPSHTGPQDVPRTHRSLWGRVGLMRHGMHGGHSRRSRVK